MATVRFHRGALAALGAVLAACSGDPASRTTAPDSGTYPRAALLDPATCKECHPKHYEEWSGSMHAYASLDPVFRAMNERGQRETGGALGDFCVKCHAPMAVQEKATVDGTDLSSVPGALQGVTCYFCHQVTDVKGTHDNPLLLANDTTMRGGIADPLPYKAHGSRYSKLHDRTQLLASSSLCGACHDISVPGHFSGASQNVDLERTHAEWLGSIFADPRAPRLLTQSCGDCHMATEKGVPIASPPEPHPIMPTRELRHIHSFPAIDTALVDFPNRDAQLEKIRGLLGTELRLQTCVNLLTGEIDLTLENLSAGHNFPSGAAQDRRLWVELHAYQKDQEILTSGVVPEGKAATSLDDPHLTLIRDETFKADGTTPAHMFWDVAVIKPRSVLPVSTFDDPGANQKPVRYPLDRVGHPDHVTVTVWLEPIGLDVLDDLIASEHSDAGASIAAIRGSVPRFALVQPGPKGSGDAGGAHLPVTLDWTLAEAMSACPDGTQCHVTGEGDACLENTAPRFQAASN